MKTLQIIPIFILLVGCASKPVKPCQVERICLQHRVEMLEMLKEHRGLTMELLRTIAELEQEAGGYQ